MIGKNPSELEKTMGYVFTDKELLQRCLTHSSFTNECKCENNERLEFLGDSVISLIATEILYSRYPQKSEGELSKMRLNIIKGKSETQYSGSLGLGEYLNLGKGEEKSGRTNSKILEDTFEALIGALYLDGGYEKAFNFTLPFITEKLRDADSESANDDYKTRLQEIIQRGGHEERLQYVKVSESGPDHDKRFEVNAMLNSNIIGSGSGRSIKEAEKEAAKNALILFGEKV